MRSLTLGIVRFLWSGWVWKSGVSFSFRHIFLPLSGCRQCLQTANISQWRSITLVKNCLWWEFSFFDTKKKIDGSYYKWDYSFIVERRGGFLKLFLILGQVVLDAEVAKVGVEKKRRRSWFWNRRTFWEPQGSRRPSLSHLLTWNFAIFSQYFLQYWPGILQYFAILTWNFCLGINIFHHRRMAAAAFCFWLDFEIFRTRENVTKLLLLLAYFGK